MKKLIAALLLVTLALTAVACTTDTPDADTTVADTTVADTAPESSDETAKADPSVKSEGVMTYAEYKAAAIDAEVVVEVYVQATQSWWDNKITVYAADPDGAYFIYEMACSEEDAKRLVPGTKIKVSGVKGEWSGEVEVMEPTFEFGDEVTYISEAKDLTAELGKETLIDHQNEKAAFKDMTVKTVSFKNDAPGDDIYVTFTKDGADYDFCVEFYLTGTDTDVYKTVSALAEGDVVDVECFLYWYNGANPHITAVTKK